ncbi:Uncharacterised protein [Chlamydia trachomatis]|nr:Uncharacterised protein [Chlamydia trachomatis]
MAVFEPSPPIITNPSKSSSFAVCKQRALFSSVMILVRPVPMQLKPPELRNSSMNSSVISTVLLLRSPSPLRINPKS